MRGECVSLDPVLICARLRAAQPRAGITPLDLLEMTTGIIAANAGHYAALITDAATRRRITDAALKVRQLADQPGDITALVERAQQALNTDQLTPHIPKTTTTVDAAVQDLLDNLDQATTTGLPTPWDEVNHFLHGLAKGRIYVIGARPGIGKSLMAQALAVHWSKVHHQHVLFCSLEMPTREITKRMLCDESSVNGNAFSRQLTPSEQRAIDKAALAMTETHQRIHICDDPVQTLASIHQQARTQQRTQGLGLLIVDYLQLLQPAPGARARTREQEVAEMSRGFKRMAKDLDIPIVLVAQLNRQMTTRDDKTPGLSDLRESGAIEQDADVVILLHVPNKEMETDVDAIIAKNRDGTPGIANLLVQGWYSRVIDRPRLGEPYRHREAA